MLVKFRKLGPGITMQLMPAREDAMKQAISEEFLPLPETTVA